jgi:hypothetical protein
MRVRIAALLLVAGCKGRDAEPPGSPAQTVEAMFDAIAARDCPAFDRLIAGTLGDAIARAGCDRAMHDYHDHQLRLVRIRDVVRDGRDRRAYLVKLTVHRDGRHQDVQVRVEPVAGRWRVTTL